MQTITGIDADREIDILCGSIQRLLRMAISDWHGYLARQALHDDTWNDQVPWWSKKVPDRFDKAWALNDLKSSVQRPGLLASLVSVVEETRLSMKRDAEKLDHPPNIDKLCDAVDSLYVKIGNCDVLGV